LQSYEEQASIDGCILICLTDTQFEFNLCIFNGQHRSFKENSKKTEFFRLHVWLEKNQMSTLPQAIYFSIAEKLTRGKKRNSDRA
jgi:hypothetical protein